MERKRLTTALQRMRARKTSEEDLMFISSLEKGEEHVLPWDLGYHREVINDPEMIHQTILNKQGVRVGYAILKLNSPDEESVEFIRLVIADEFKSKGFGTFYFEYIWDHVFKHLSKKRIWHDVFIENVYATKLYKKLGYMEFDRGVDPTTNRGLIFFELTKKTYLSWR